VRQNGILRQVPLPVDFRVTAGDLYAALSERVLLEANPAAILAR
jgi:hypothetical protein